MIPSPLDRADDLNDAEGEEPSQSQNEEESSDSDESSEDINNADGIEADSPSFVPNDCIFCGLGCDTFENNMVHMRKTHGFIVPYQEHLTVDLETLVWFMHLIIHSYHECISCGIHRRSAEAVQQHMTSLSHCRPNLSSDVAEFYTDLPPELIDLNGVGHPEEGTMRLKSGKILTHRSQVQTSHDPNRQRITRQPSGQPRQLGSSAQRKTDSSELEKQDRKATSLDLQLSQMSVNDQRSLAHLPTSEQRSVLAVRKKQLDNAQRAERRARSQVERMGNQTLMKNFKNDVPGPKLG